MVNSLDYAYDELKEFFELREEDISGIQKSMNEKGVNFSVPLLMKTIHTSYERTKRIFDGICWIAHKYTHHKEVFEKDCEVFDRDIKLAEKVKKFLEGLNENGSNGLNLFFELNRQNDLDRNTIDSLGFKTFLRDITDENKKLIGYVPLSKITLTLLDEEGEEKTLNVDLTFRGLQSIIDGLLGFKKEFEDSINNYKEKLGVTVVTGE